MMLLTVEGRADVLPEQKPRGVLSSASEGYAAALGLRVLQGRWLMDHEPTPVFVINETLARQAFPGADPIGKRIRLPFVDSSSDFALVVGVVADLRYSKLGTASEPELFLDYAHARVAGTTLTVVPAPTPCRLHRRSGRCSPVSIARSHSSTCDGWMWRSPIRSRRAD